MKTGMKVIDYGTKDVLLSYGDTAGEIIEVVRMNHNEEMGFDRSQGSDEERFFLCVSERGEDCTFTVKDICTANSVTYNWVLDNTLFKVSAGDAALIHDRAIVHVFDSNYVSVATGSFSSSDGGFNVPGDWSSSTLIGFQYSVGGDRVFLSAGILFGNVRVQQVTGSREYDFMIVEESDEV